MLTAGLVALTAAGAVAVQLGPFRPEVSPEAVERGESVVAKLPARSGAIVRQPSEVTPHPTGAAPAPSQTPDEPKLEGLMTIPSLSSLAAQPKPSGGEATQLAEEEELPWDMVEPVPLSTSGLKATAKADAASPGTIQTDTNSFATTTTTATQDAAAMRWVKASAAQIKGGDRARAIYHFDFWLDVPEGVRQRLASVSYEFNTPAVMPQSQMSRDRASGFRVSAGGLTCPDAVAVTLKFKDDGTQRITIDGCQLLRQAEKDQRQE